MEDNNTNDELNKEANKHSQSIPPIPPIGSSDPVSPFSQDSIKNEDGLGNSGIYSTKIPSVPPPAFQFESSLDLGFVREKVASARQEAKAFIIGQEEMIDLLLIGIFTNGHILLEGVPGIAKTLSAKVLSKCLDTDFSRIQFTPDLMPSDILGTSVFNMKTSEFTFNKGPIFSNIILIDEVNRAPAKTQSALFEVMEERQITYEGVKYEMEFPFLIIATQNPVEQEGTYSLPEAQLDRFLFKIILDYPTLEQEQEILSRYKNTTLAPNLDTITKVFSKADLLKIQDLVSKIKIEDALMKYIATITHNTRNHAKLYLGASPRATLAMAKSAKAMAAIRGRDFITPDDIQSVANYVLNHRIILTPEAEMEGLSTKSVIEEIIHKIEVPR
ncbi:MoxR family ATPase [Flavobacteriales bacterium]|nr:MoxR family ATPase [Flavobacteriales bacterium]